MIDYPSINPVAVDFGLIKIHWYGISYVVGILLAWWFLHNKARKQPLLAWTTVQVSDLIFYGMLGIIIGGRLGSVLFYNFSYYIQHPIEVFYIHQGGMSFHGGLLGVLFSLWIYSRKVNQTFFETTDFIAPAVPIGLFFGRVANFVNGELWGAPTNLPWAVIFPDPAAGGLLRHPSQLYEALLEGIILFIILWVYSGRIRPKMAVSGLFLIAYGIFRFMVEFVREPDQHLGYLAFDWFTMGQLLTLPMIIYGLFLMFKAYKKI